MKKALLLIVLAAACVRSYAQPWVKQTGERIKFADAAAQYIRVEKDEEEEERERKEERARGRNGGREMEEDENYLFDRWYWYWNQHLDTNGYMVSGRVNMEEWNKVKAGTVAAKTTAANWVFQGPTYCEGGYSGLGRINTIGFDPVDSNTIYIGSAGGGTWKTTDGGANWTCLYDQMGTLSVGDIKINPLNRNTVYVATGDPDGYDNYSTGIIRSYDGGTNWTTLGPAWTPDSMRMIRTIVINYADTSHLTLATMNGIYKSYNSGATWIKTNNLNFRQIVCCPADTTIWYGTIEGGTAQVVRSTNGGLTWTPVTTFTGARRINLAVTPAAPNVVKAIASNDVSGLLGIYNSFDFGATFTAAYEDDPTCSHNLLGYDLELPTTACNGQGWYDLCIAISPTDYDKVLVGGVNNYYSDDGGLSWAIANGWFEAAWLPDLETVHADKHWLGYNPLNGAAYLGCDGGIYKNYSPLTGPWIHLSNGLGITQFYRNAVDNGVTFCIGGAQDNGTKMVQGTTYTDLTGGDGMQPLINYADPANTFYCAYQNGHVDVTTDAGVHFNSITDDLPTPGAWVTPYMLHPTDPYTLFIGYKQVFASNDGGGFWMPISPIFDATYNIERLAIAQTDPNYIYAVRPTSSRSKIHYTTDLGATWDTIPTPFPNYIYISDIVVDPTDAKHIYVTLSGYSSQRVFSYNLASASWTNESSGLPVVPVNCMVIDTFSKTKYVGTDVAVYYKTTEMTSWGLFNNHLPSVNINDLNINHTTNELWAATFGRGMWKTQKNELTPPPPNSIKGVGMVAGQITLSPNPCHDAFIISSSDVPFRNADVNVKLVTVDGKVAMTTKGTFDTAGKLRVNVSGMAPGVYFCEVANEKGVARGKVVVY